MPLWQADGFRTRGIRVGSAVDVVRREQHPKDSNHRADNDTRRLKRYGLVNYGYAIDRYNDLQDTFEHDGLDDSRRHIYYASHDDQNRCAAYGELHRINVGPQSEQEHDR